MGQIYSISGNSINGRLRFLDTDIVAGASIALLSCSAAINSIEWTIFFDKEINALAVPNAPTLSSSTTGGSILRSTNIYIRMTTVDSSGVEGQPCDSNAPVITGASTDTNKITVTWTAIPGASFYNIYAGTRSGMESYVGQTSTTSLVLTSTPANTPLAIPTNPDIVISGKQGGAEQLPISGSSVFLANKIIVYASASTVGQISFTCILN